MGAGVETRFELKITYSDTLINYQLSQNLKLLGNNEFNHLTIILTAVNSEKSKEVQQGLLPMSLKTLNQ
jgi:hypothetical protein